MDRTYKMGGILELICDHDEYKATVRGRTFSTCLNQARRKGWKIHTETRTATCPQCSRGKLKVTVKRKRVAV